MASLYETTGLSVRVSNPVIQNGKWIQTLTEDLTSYDHESAAMGGYDRANISFGVNRLDIAEWLNEGLGRDIEVRNGAGVVVWNGMANVVNANEGGRKVVVGPLLEVANRISMNYAIVIEGSGTEQIIGEQVSTEWADNTDSQSAYGKWEKVVNGSARTTPEAEQARNVVLSKYSWPPTTYDISTAGDVTVQLQCVGYQKWLDAFVYNNDTVDEVLTSAKVRLIMEASEAVNSGVLSTDYTRIENSTAYIETFEDRDRTGTTVIKDAAAMGDANDDYWTFGIYAGRQAVFNVVPGELAYLHRRGTGPVVERLGGGVVDPWDVKAGQWLFMPDSMPGSDTPIPTTRAEFYKDKRVAFIERVTFNAPYGFSVFGTRLRRAAQGLAKLGLGSL